MKKPSRRSGSGSMLNLYEAKSRLSELVDRAARGEEIVIAKRGCPLAQLVPLVKPKRQFGLLRGQIWIADDFDAPLPPEIQKYFEPELDEEE